MKKILTLSLYAFLLTGFFSISSCTKEPLIIPYNLTEYEFDIPANPYQAYQTYTFNLLHADVQTVLTAAGITDMGRVQKAALKSGFKAKASVTGTNLDEILSVEVYMKEMGTGGDGTQVAYSQNIGSGASETLLLINGADLKMAVTKDVTFTVKVLNKPTGNSALKLKLGQGIIDVTVRQ